MTSFPDSAPPTADYWSATTASARPRQVTVIGAGIVGLASAAALSRAGHQVTVIDRAAAAGQGASGGNGCQLSYGYVAPLAQPGLPFDVPGLMLSRHGPLHITPRADVRQWRWMWEFLRACSAPVAQRSTLELLALGALSRQETEQWIAGASAEALSFSRSGKLVLYATQSSFDAGRRQAELQAPHGPLQSALPGDGFLAHEPALASFRGAVAGSIYTPDECAIDGLALCRNTEEVLRSRGVVFEYGVTVHGLRREGARVSRLLSSAGDRPVDALVLAGGAGSAALAASAGLRVPVYPLKGYSITVPVRDPAAVPSVSVTDAKRKVVYARIGDRLRVAGFVEIGARDGAVDPRRIEQLQACTQEAFGGAVDIGAAVPWAGLRPATPTSLPIVGRSGGVENLFLNVGHGALGLTLAFGTARRLADAF
ncbi:FAD-dependent oxidoreductase [Xylophilus rhododendri]|uniref:FAD-dependent oxidoreductase n=1 Tax=Xylophilus rhododendri TaxID=2697032 RepID=A0A857J170_9BURK|nr:D-amino acid dehydrogenase [Xylophilus rhododendri]QHI97446.1 FAD-dependent oxidoreductase [Xylophilus rhododendri]